MFMSFSPCLVVCSLCSWIWGRLGKVCEPSVARQDLLYAHSVCFVPWSSDLQFATYRLSVACGDYCVAQGKPFTTCPGCGFGPIHSCCLPVCLFVCCCLC